MHHRAKPVTRLVSLVVALGAFLAACGPRPGLGGENAALVDNWRSIETPSFVVWHSTASRSDDARHVADSCERIYRELRGKWFARSKQAAWASKCHVVLHDHIDGYLAAVGQAGAQTFGSSIVQRKQNEIVLRRIDLRGDARSGRFSALAHELTHVILADRIPNARVPVWADEGLALLADADEKQLRHLRDLDDAILRRDHFPTIELLALDGYPGAGRWGTFYGQSASLVQFFLDQGTPEQLMTFLELAGTSGYDAALRATYGIRDARELDRRWREYHATSRSGVYALDRAPNSRRES